MSLLRFGTVAQALDALRSGRATARDIAERSLAACETGEGPRAVLTVYRTRALAAAEHLDAVLTSGGDAGPLGGVPLTVKDLFDVGGEPTRAGSAVLQDAAPAASDAVALRTLRGQGAVIVGKTHMTEFAFSGVGMNPHFETPRNPIRRQEARIPGGSSSGAAVSVADGMTLGAIGSDTAGSLRVPAALCGLTGFKPSGGRHSMQGVFPLSRTLDTIGPIARTVDCCRRLDAGLAGQTPLSLPAPLAGTRFGVPQTLVLDDLDPAVASAFSSALERLSRAGAIVVEVAMSELADMKRLAALGNIAPAEAFALHRDRLALHRDRLDPRVAARIEGGAKIGAADYLDMLDIRRSLKARVAVTSAMFDALIMPTVPIIAPRIDDLETDEAFFEANGLLLRNTMIANVLDRPAVSLPVQPEGAHGVGLSLMGAAGADARLLDIAEAVERTLAMPAGDTRH